MKIKASGTKYRNIIKKTVSSGKSMNYIGIKLQKQTLVHPNKLVKKFCDQNSIYKYRNLIC